MLPSSPPSSLELDDEAPTLATASVRPYYTGDLQAKRAIACDVAHTAIFLTKFDHSIRLFFVNLFFSDFV